ncbi:DUF459 domain-containing protein [Helicobacter sp.]|uniref:SGNH/GDSL hydrolase family protein n=1 Tax=Helicobacter sp. TaxID=218 RepID=UPI0038910492
MRIIGFYTTLVLSFLLVLLVMNRSVHTYIEQKYHITPFDTQNPILELLSLPALWLESARNALLPLSQDLIIANAENHAQNQSGSEEPESSQIEPEAPKYPLISEDGHIVLEADSTFLFIGDSMMQGVGMTLGRELKKLGFSVIDIAKQSTGLTYTDFFDWGKMLKDTLDKHPRIDVVVIMVGANDPYNMPKIKYASPEWVEIYESRIEEILESANAHGALVVWYEAPIVKKEPLNTKLAFLNTLYAAKVAQAVEKENKALLLHSNNALAPNGSYTAYGKNADGKSIKLRANDGIHFSGEGSRVLGALLLERLEILPAPQEKQEAEEQEAGMAAKSVESSLDSTLLDSASRADSAIKAESSMPESHTLPASPAPSAEESSQDFGVFGGQVAYE